MSTALDIVNVALRDHNLKEISGFSTTQEFPGNIVKDVLNEVIRELNRMGNFWFSESKTPLPFSPSVYSYSFKALGIDPRRVIRIQREATGYWGELEQVNWRDFQKHFRTSTLATAQPSQWSKYGDSLELSSQPDQNYSLYAYHYRDMPVITSTADSQTSGAILVPENDEDLLERGCYFMLGYKIGKWDYITAVQQLKIKANPFLVSSQQDSGIAHQMPSLF